MTCCRAMRVGMLEGEGKLGPIRLEVILKSMTGPTSAREISLGEIFVPMTVEPQAWLAGTPTLVVGGASW